ncbi:DgyrCDS13331 [Dimorphilus gyrociliatus]|uniref:DgyrCDS13331 n=1 Tax=Dimorphilus gyrociliatus TaxID=2664684 RepID=A0A7I8WAD9_9ANNE|nr:DgyrCDS13331 [Dimorphilus gyrociliatus]
MKNIPELLYVELQPPPLIYCPFGLTKCPNESDKEDEDDEIIFQWNTIPHLPYPGFNPDCTNQDKLTEKKKMTYYRIKKQSAIIAITDLVKCYNSYLSEARNNVFDDL